MQFRYYRDGFTDASSKPNTLGKGDPAGDFLPLLHQQRAADGTVNSTVLEQPLDFTTLAIKYVRAGWRSVILLWLWCEGVYFVCVVVCGRRLCICIL